MFCERPEEAPLGAVVGVRDAAGARFEHALNELVARLRQAGRE
ncbi:hypothetical protein [Nonomuraea sp. NPDC003754]